MLRELFDRITTMADERRAPVEIPVGDPRFKTFKIGAETLTYDIPPEPRKHVVNSLKALTDFANRTEGNSQVIWHRHETVILILDDEDRREKVGLHLESTSQFSYLKEIYRAQHHAFEFTQRDFVFAMIHILGVTTEAVAPFRSLDWSVLNAVTGEVTQTKDRIGTDIRAEVASKGRPLPDRLTIGVRVYATDANEYPLSVKIELVPSSQRILLILEDSCIDNLVDRRHADLQEELESLAKGCEVYYGSP